MAINSMFHYALVFGFLSRYSYLYALYGKKHGRRCNMTILGKLGHDTLGKRQLIYIFRYILRVQTKSKNKLQENLCRRKNNANNNTI